VCIQEEEGEKKTKIKKPFKATGKIENMYKKKTQGTRRIHSESENTYSLH